MLKEFLSQKGISYQERDVTRDPTAAQEVMQRTGRMAVPVTVINGQTVVGFDRARLEQLLAQAPPGLGAAVADAARFGRSAGAYVGRVRPGSAAERLGLKPGDVIAQVNGQIIDSAADLERVMSSMSRGSPVSVIFLRADTRSSGQAVL